MPGLNTTPVKDITYFLNLSSVLNGQVAKQRPSANSDSMMKIGMLFQH